MVCHQREYFGLVHFKKNKNFILQMEDGHLLFDFGVVNTTDDVCEQQIQSIAVCLQQLTTLVASRQMVPYLHLATSQL